MIKYSHHTIRESKHIETNESLYELLYWYISDKAPDIAGCRSFGYFKTEKEANDQHNNNLKNGVHENENN
jgi:hypothetical protein